MTTRGSPFTQGTTFTNSDSNQKNATLRNNSKPQGGTLREKKFVMPSDQDQSDQLVHLMHQLNHHLDHQDQMLLLTNHQTHHYLHINQSNLKILLKMRLMN